MQKQFQSLAEVAEAGKKQNKIYVVYLQQVLDVTDFDHPGPKENITDNVGKDITELFEDAEHSNYAIELCQKYVIGQLADNTGKLLQNDFIQMSKEEEELHKQIENKIDIKKPLISQVKKLTNKEFMFFVKRPRFMESHDGI